MRQVLVRLAASGLLAFLAYTASMPIADAGARQVATTFKPLATRIANPERGFWRFVAEDFAAVTQDDLDNVRAADLTMAYAVVRLDAFRARALTPALLNRLDAAFAKTRSAGIKVILRFAYNYPENETEYEDAEDAPLAIVLQHGAWGEGHTSSNGLDLPAPKRAIRDALLAALPASRQLQWRYPPDLIAWSPNAGPGGNFPRIGFHNDCFMSSPTDVGTYDEDPSIRAGQRAYAARLTRTTLFGGETCDIEGEAARTSCASILTEGARFHLTTLNRDYARKFHERWIRDGCFGEVTRSMGYRLELRSALVDAEGERGGTVAAAVRIRNVGWARPANGRPLQLVLRHAASGRTYRVSSGDLRNVTPEDTTPDRFGLSWRVPGNAPTGRYLVGVAAPDPVPRLAARPAYAVRFANANDPAGGQRWDAQRAVFNTGLSVTIAP
jgi:hypothetical protein